MKLEARVKVKDCTMLQLVGTDPVVVNVDADYVEANEHDVYEWVANELYDMYGATFGLTDFDILNIDDILADLNDKDLED